MLFTLSAFTALLAGFAAADGCGWVDVGTVTLRIDTCYVQCQEVTEECWDQKFTCDDDGNLRVTFYRDADEDCGGNEIATVSVDPASDSSVEAYSCSGSADTCTTFHYQDNVHNPDSDECGFRQVDVQLVAEACFTTDDGLYMKQNCDDEYTVSYCTDSACTQDCTTSTKNIYGLDGDHCMDVQCYHHETGETVGVPLFLKGTRRFSVYNNFKPQNWTAVMWVGVMLSTLIAVSLLLQCRMYFGAKKGSLSYHPLKQIVDSDTEMEKLAQ